MVIFHGYVSHNQRVDSFLREMLIHSISLESHRMCCDSGDSHSIHAARASAFKTCGVLQHISKMVATCVQRSVVFTCQVPLYDWGDAAARLAADMVRYLVTGETSLWCLCHVELNDSSDYVTVSMMSMMSMSVCWRCVNHDGTVSRAWSLPQFSSRCCWFATGLDAGFPATEWTAWIWCWSDAPKQHCQVQKRHPHMGPFQTYPVLLYIQ